MNKQFLDFLVDQLEIAFSALYDEFEGDYVKMASAIFSVSCSSLDNMLMGIAKTKKYGPEMNNDKFQKMLESIKKISDETAKVKTSLSDIISQLESLK